MRSGVTRALSDLEDMMRTVYIVAYILASLVCALIMLAVLGPEAAFLTTAIAAGLPFALGAVGFLVLIVGWMMGGSH